MELGLAILSLVVGIVSIVLALFSMITTAKNRKKDYTNLQKYPQTHRRTR